MRWDRLQAEGISSSSVVECGEVGCVVSDWLDDVDIDKNTMTKHVHAIEVPEGCLMDEMAGDDNQSGPSVTQDIKCSPIA